MERRNVRQCRQSLGGRNTFKENRIAFSLISSAQHSRFKVLHQNRVKVLCTISNSYVIGLYKIYLFVVSTVLFYFLINFGAHFKFWVRID